jgi:hypothetical protein
VRDRPAVLVRGRHRVLQHSGRIIEDFQSTVTLLLMIVFFLFLNRVFHQDASSSKIISHGFLIVE